MEVESASETNDTPMKEQSTVNEENTSENSKEKTFKRNRKQAQGKPTQISYRASLLGHEPMEVDKDFDELVKEWFTEGYGSIHTEEQKKIIEKLPRIDIPDERWKQMCLPWKDAIVIKPLGRRFYLYELKDRLRWLWGAPDFELIDLPNNYYVMLLEQRKNNCVKRYLTMVHGSPYLSFSSKIGNSKPSTFGKTTYLDTNLYSP